MSQLLKIKIWFQDFQQNIKKKIEIEDDCQIAEIIDIFVDEFKLDHQFHLCRDKDGIQILDDSKTLKEHNINNEQILYCFKNPRGSKVNPVLQDNKQLENNKLGQQKNNQPPIIGFIGNIPICPLGTEQFKNRSNLNQYGVNPLPFGEIGYNNGLSENKQPPSDQLVNDQKLLCNIDQQVNFMAKNSEPMQVDKKLDLKTKLTSNEIIRKMHFDFYFNNILLSATQIITISKDESFVTLQTLDQSVKFVSFKQDATKDYQEVNVLEEQVDVFIKYHNTTVVSLKNQIGCIIYWNNDKVTERIIKINQ